MTRYLGPAVLYRLPLQAPIQVLCVIYPVVLAIGLVLSLTPKGTVPLYFILFTQSLGL